jgi:hypothetical protein
MDPKLIEKVRKELVDERKRGISSTIPKLCKDFNISDEYIMLSVIGDLEVSGEAILAGFDTVYREDGGAIYLAKYTGRV